MRDPRPIRGLPTGLPSAGRTAMHRGGLSYPAQAAVSSGLLDGGTVLDYGCGRGGDVTRLARLGYDVNGWDPHHRPHPPPGPADVVLLTYVLNVIARPSERATALTSAWSLARKVLVVSVRTTREDGRVAGLPEGDGVRTSRGTFQTLFEPGELRTWTEATTGVRPLPASPGVLLLFRDPSALASHLMRTFGRPDDHRNGTEVLETLAGFVRRHGRLPGPGEDPSLATTAARAFRGPANAATAARTLVGDAEYEAAARRGRADVLVTLAMDALTGGTPTSELPPDVVYGARHHYGGVNAARARATELLASLGRADLVRRATRASRIGKLTPTALYLHADALPWASAALRTYAGCAELASGSPAGANVLKLHHDRPAVSFLSYPDFDRDPHPRLSESLTVDLARHHETWTDYRLRQNRPLLHRKEEFLRSGDPRRGLYERLTRQEVRAGLYAHPATIGTEHGWDAALAAASATHRGHRLVHL